MITTITAIMTVMNLIPKSKHDNNQDYDDNHGYNIDSDHDDNTIDDNCSKNIVETIDNYIYKIHE